MERRKEDYEVMIELREFIADNRQWRISTDDYRKSLCEKVNIINHKLEELNNRIYELPCKTRVGLYESVKTQLKYIWALIVAMVGAIITTFFRRQ